MSPCPRPARQHPASGSSPARVGSGVGGDVGIGNGLGSVRVLLHCCSLTLSARVFGLCGVVIVHGKDLVGGALGGRGGFRVRGRVSLFGVWIKRHTKELSTARRVG